MTFLGNFEMDLSTLTVSQQKYHSELLAKKKKLLTTITIERQACQNTIQSNYFLKRDKGVLENYQTRLSELPPIFDEEEKKAEERIKKAVEAKEEILRQADERIRKAIEAKETLLKSHKNQISSLQTRIDEKAASIKQQEEHLINGNKTRTLIRAENELAELEKQKKEFLERAFPSAQTAPSLPPPLSTPLKETDLPPVKKMEVVEVVNSFDYSQPINYFGDTKVDFGDSESESENEASEEQLTPEEIAEIQREKEERMKKVKEKLAEKQRLKETKQEQIECPQPVKSSSSSSLATSSSPFGTTGLNMISPAIKLLEPIKEIQSPQLPPPVKPKILKKQVTKRPINSSLGPQVQTYSFPCALED